MPKAGARPKRPAKRGPSQATRVVAGTARPAKPTTAKKVRNRASAAAKKAGGPSIPLRDLIRGGMPRSRKARGGVAGGEPGRQHSGDRMREPFGLKSGSGTTLMQYEPPPLEHVGTQRAAIPKR